MRLFLLFCFLACRLISIGASHARKKRKENQVKISRRKRLILLKEMAQRGFSQKYYTHPLYTEVEKTIKRYVKIMQNEKGELSFVAQVFLVRMVENEWLLKQLSTFMTRQSPGRFVLKAIEHFYEEKAIRPIKDWQPQPEDLISNNALQLVAFLFEQYPVPKHIARHWLHFPFEKHIQQELNELIEVKSEARVDSAYFDLYFHLAEGLNVRSWKPAYFKPSKKEVHIWMHTQEERHINLLDSFWRAVYLARGGKFSEHLMSHLPLSLKHLPFWRQFMDMLVREETKELNYSEVSELIHLICWVKFGENKGIYNVTGMEDLRSSQPDLSLKRERLSSLKKKVFRDIKSEYALPEGFLEKYVFTDVSGQLFQIRQLKSRWELQKEAKEMKNCLDDLGYHISAYNGDAHFWSLRVMDKLPEGTPLVSIEVSGKLIKEYQGQNNSYPEAHLIEIIEQWAEENELAVSAYEEDY